MAAPCVLPAAACMPAECAAATGALRSRAAARGRRPAAAAARARARQPGGRYTCVAGLPPPRARARARRPAPGARAAPRRLGASAARGTVVMGSRPSVPPSRPWARSARLLRDRRGARRAACTWASLRSCPDRRSPGGGDRRGERREAPRMRARAPAPLLRRRAGAHRTRAPGPARRAPRGELPAIARPVRKRTRCHAGGRSQSTFGSLVCPHSCPGRTWIGRERASVCEIERLLRRGTQRHAWRAARAARPATPRGGAGGATRGRGSRVPADRVERLAPHQ